MGEADKSGDKIPHASGCMGRNKKCPAGFPAGYILETADFRISTKSFTPKLQSLRIKPLLVIE
jgi:hypothetical protein